MEGFRDITFIDVDWIHAAVVTLSYDVGVTDQFRDISFSKNLFYGVNLKARQNVADLGTDGNMSTKLN